MKLSMFDFDLPSHFIAQRPAVPRDSARLLRVLSGKVSDHHVTDLPLFLCSNDIIIYNDTKVIPTRLQGRRDDVSVEVTLHRQCDDDSWYAFVRPARKLQEGDRLRFSDDFYGDVFEKRSSGEILLSFPFSGSILLDVLREHAYLPLPPYISRESFSDERDEEDYQTVFASCEGAVAAPTAGLHFTESLIEQVRQLGVEMLPVTLHVGAGTFLPVRSERIADHTMHSEYGEISADVAEKIEAARSSGGRVIAVGTTTLRLLETVAFHHRGFIRQWCGDTNIFITPGFHFRVADMLMTNFHLPRSTLFMLVCAFSGLNMMKYAYEHAKIMNYRFYSYGDCCLLTRHDDELRSYA